MTNKELYEKISDQRFTMRRGISNSMNHAAFYEQMKNILLNNLDQIVDALQYAAEAEAKINVLELELNDAERELDEKDKQIKELTAAAAKKTTGKKKPSGVSDE